MTTTPSPIFRGEQPARWTLSEAQVFFDLVTTRNRERAETYLALTQALPAPLRLDDYEITSVATFLDGLVHMHRDPSRTWTVPHDLDQPMPPHAHAASETSEWDWVRDAATCWWAEMMLTWMPGGHWELHRGSDIDVNQNLPFIESTPPHRRDANPERMLMGYLGNVKRGKFTSGYVEEMMIAGQANILRIVAENKPPPSPMESVDVTRRRSRRIEVEVGDDYRAAVGDDRLEGLSAALTAVDGVESVERTDREMWVLRVTSAKMKDIRAVLVQMLDDAQRTDRAHG